MRGSYPPVYEITDSEFRPALSSSTRFCDNSPISALIDFQLSVSQSARYCDIFALAGIALLKGKKIGLTTVLPPVYGR